MRDEDLNIAEGDIAKAKANLIQPNIYRKANTIGEDATKRTTTRMTKHLLAARRSLVC